MGDEVARTMADRWRWWGAERIARLLDATERAVVWGDLVESQASSGRALRELLGLVARRQAAVWRSGAPWLALLLVAVPMGIVLAFVTRWWADANAWELAPYLRRGFSWSFLENPGIRNDAIEVVVRMAVDGLSIVAWSWTCGFALGTLSRRTRWITCAVVAILVFTATLGTTTTARAVGNREIYSTFFVGVLHPWLLGVVFVLLPLEWGMHVSTRRVSLPLAPTVAVALAVILLTAWQAPGVEAAFTYGAGVMPLAGRDGVGGTLDDVRKFQLVPTVVMAMPAMIVAMLAVRQQRQRGPLSAR